MNRAIKQQWIKALRSGEYEQGIHALRSGDRYCCLGVLCDLYDSKLWFNVRDNYSYMNADDLLPDEVVNWAELDSDNGVFIGDSGEKQDLSTLNDTGKTFSQLADLIERYL
jgi:hypothetical protein